MLDEAAWNAPANAFYGFIEGRRTWIVRDHLLDAVTQHDTVDPRPGLLSSRAMEGLVAWVERVEVAESSHMLTARGIQMLWPLLLCLAAGDKMNVLGGRLHDDTARFLTRVAKQHRKRFKRALQAGKGVWARTQ